MSGADKTTRKTNYFNKLIKYLDQYGKIVLCGADNVGSTQLQKIRKALRGKAEILMGKNTMIRKAIRGHLQNNARLESVLPFIKGNVGLIFTNDELSNLKKVLEDQKVSAPAKAGAICNTNVMVPPGPTGLEPTQTSFFQALNIPTKINKGQIEIVSEVHLLKPGQKVGASEANLLAKLDIKPFKYGLLVQTIYDNGSIYDAKVLEITKEYIYQKFAHGAKNVAAISMLLHEPNLTSIPHMISNGFKNVLSVALAVDFPIKQTEKLKTATPVHHAPATTTETTKGKPAEIKKPEPEPEPEDMDGGIGGLFD